MGTNEAATSATTTNSGERRDRLVGLVDACTDQLAAPDTNPNAHNGRTHNRGPVRITLSVVTWLVCRA